MKLVLSNLVIGLVIVGAILIQDGRGLFPDLDEAINLLFISLFFTRQQINYFLNRIYDPITTDYMKLVALPIQTGIELRITFSSNICNKIKPQAVKDSLLAKYIYNFYPIVFWQSFYMFDHHVYHK